MSVGSGILLSILLKQIKHPNHAFGPSSSTPISELLVYPVECRFARFVHQVFCGGTVGTLDVSRLEFFASNLVRQCRLFSGVKHANVTTLASKVKLCLPLSRRAHRDPSQNGCGQRGCLVVVPAGRLVKILDRGCRLGALGFVGNG